MPGRQTSTKSTKRLLSGELSVGSSDIDLADRNSPVSMSETEEPHHYANPLELQKDVQVELDKIDGRKKKNLLYEPIPLSTGKQNGYHAARKNSLEDAHSFSSRYSQHDKLYRFLFVVLFLMSFGAFLLSILTSFGILNNCGNCMTTEKYPGTIARQTQPKDDVKLQEVERNLTQLNDVIIPSLLRQVSSLQAKIQNKTLRGEPGIQGPPGLPGPPGAGDLSKCEYRTEATTTSQVQDNPGRFSETSTVKIIAKPNYIILGASCTTIGGSEHGLFQELFDGNRRYYCKCAGKSQTLAFEQASSLSCRIHVWECPISS